MATWPGVGELCCRYGLQQRGELCLSGKPGAPKFHTAPRHLQGRPGWVHLHRARGPLPVPAGQGNTVQKSVLGPSHQDQKKSLPCIEQDLQGMPAKGVLSWEGERETVLGDLLSGRIRT